MLTMPSVISASNLVSRPALVAEAVRPAAPPRAIEPTTAVSKERSRTEHNTPDTPASAGAFYLSNGKNKGVEGVDDAAPDVGRQGSGFPIQVQPPTEKSEIQKAMEAQIKELLTNVWKASAKAVDFLLRRDSAETSRSVLTAQDLEQKKGAVAAVSDTNGGAISYNAQGGRLSDDVMVAGQLLDVLA